MLGNNRYLFVSYAREDIERVRPLVEAVRTELASRALPVDVWMDVTDLNPGQQWDIAISEALQASVGFLFFLSPGSLRSEWVRREMTIAATTGDRLIIPVVLHEPLNVPPTLAEWQWLRYVGRPTRDDTVVAATQIADATERFLRVNPQLNAAVSQAEAPFIAADIADDVRSSVEPTLTHGAPDSVFVVHGHDAAALIQLEHFLQSVGIEAIVLSKQDESPQSLFQKFLMIGGKARFAIVLIGADDYGASRRQYDAAGVADRALQFRARQNVILELGFFYGKLGWENVFVVYKHPDRVFPNFERPSDLDGVVLESIDDSSWQRKLSQRLAEAGFDLCREPNNGAQPTWPVDT
jgi:predicted nucleotide-binding protein